MAPQPFKVTYIGQFNNTVYILMLEIDTTDFIYTFGTTVNTSLILVLVFPSSKQRPGFDNSILGETGAGQGYTGSRAPPLVVVEAGAEFYLAVLRRGKVREVNARQDEHHRLQHLLMSSAGTDNRDQRGTRGRGRKQGGGGRCKVEYRLNAFLGCALFWFGGGVAVMFGGREGAGHSVLWSLWLQCFGFSWRTKTRQRSEGEESTESIEVMTHDEKWKSMTLYVELVPFKIE